MKQDLGTFSDVLFCMEGHGVPKDVASNIAALLFQWGVSAAMVRMRSAVPLPADAPQLSFIEGGIPAKPKVKAEPKKALHRIPADMKLTQALHQFAKERAFAPQEIDNMWTKFFNHYDANGETAVNWESKWRTWVMRGVEYKNRDQRQQGGNLIDGRL